MSSSLSSSPGVASSVSASSVASEVRLSSSRNCLAVPGVVGDPFTAFDVDEATGYLVTGTAVGSVRLWRLDHISSVVIGGAAAARRLTVDTGNSPPTTPQPASDITDEIACRVLAPSSEEGVKHIFIHDQQIYAVIGDVNVKVWCSWHDVNCQVRRIDRAHDYRTCKESFTLRHDRKILVLTANANTGIMLDMEMMTQITFQLPVPSSSIPLYFNGTHLLMLHQGANGTRLVQVYDAVAQRLVKTLLLDKADKFYWGFQLLTRSPPSTASSSVVPPAAVDTTTTAASSSVVESKSNGLAAAAHAANTTYLSYISRHNVIKCVPLNAFPSGIPASVLEQQGAPTDRPSTRQLVTDRIITGGSNVRIIAYIYDEVDNTFITLNSDAKVKVFGLAAGADAAAAAEAAAAATHTSPETTPFPGVLLHKYRNVAGTFKIGYPYVMKKIGARLLFYTADEGIFVIRLDDK